MATATRVVEGTVVEVQPTQARVQFPNGDARWFTINNERERERFALGKVLKFRASTFPKNRDELFAHIEGMLPKNIADQIIKYSLMTWEEESEDPTRMVFDMGQGLTLNEAVTVFGSPNAEYFFVKNEDSEQITSKHHYVETAEIEDALLRITELLSGSPLKFDPAQA
jgi:hypothetical protein